MMLAVTILAIVAMTNCQESDYEVVHLTEFCRHGARTSGKDMFQLKINAVYGNSALTGNGLRQHYIVGLQIRKSYPELFETYDPDKIDILCSYEPRTIQSAMAQATGLFPLGLGFNISLDHKSDLLNPPLDGIEASFTNESALPKAYRPFKYQMISPELDFMFLHNLSMVCPEANNEYQRYQKAIMRKFDGHVADLSEQLTESGFDPKKLKNKDQWDFIGISELYDEFRSYENYYGKIYHKIPADLHEKVIRLGVLRLAIKYSSTKLAMLSSDGVAKDMIEAMDEVVKGRSDKVFRMYSGHDNTLYVQMLGFNLTDFDCIKDWALMKIPKRSCLTPPYFAGTLMYELATKDGIFYARGLLNGKSFKICEIEHGDHYCKYELFKKTVQDKLYYTDSDYESFCGSTYLKSATPVEKSETLVLVLVVIFFSSILSIQIIMYLWMTCNEGKLKNRYRDHPQSFNHVASLLDQ